VDGVKVGFEGGVNFLVQRRFPSQHHAYVNQGWCGRGVLRRPLKMRVLAMLYPNSTYVYLIVLNICVVPDRCSVFTYVQVIIHSFLSGDHHLKIVTYSFALNRTKLSNSHY